MAHEYKKYAESEHGRKKADERVKAQSKAMGGAVKMTAGADSGVGRLEKAKIAVKK